MIVGAASVLAGQVETLPSQQNIPLPPKETQPPLTTQNQPQDNESTIPHHLPGSQGATRDIPLPQVFRGCWRGSVPRIDTLVPLQPEAARTIWLTKSIKVQSVSGPDRAELIAYLHFRARPLSMFGMPGFGPANTLDELTHLHCSVTSDKATMDVHAKVFVGNNSQPYANITWRTRFVRTSPESND